MSEMTTGKSLYPTMLEVRDNIPAGRRPYIFAQRAVSSEISVVKIREAIAEVAAAIRVETLTPPLTDDLAEFVTTIDALATPAHELDSAVDGTDGFGTQMRYDIAKLVLHSVIDHGNKGVQ